jgi:hypothetical protein
MDIAVVETGGDPGSRAAASDIDAASCTPGDGVTRELAVDVTAA